MTKQHTRDSLAERDRPAIEITPQMIDAGLMHLIEYQSEDYPAADLVRGVFAAMWEALPESSRPCDIAPRSGWSDRQRP